jgi:DinB family protein
MSVHDTLIASLEAQQKEIDQRLAGLPEAVLDQEGAVGEASIKNILAQLTAWELVVVQALLEGIETGVRSPVLGEIEGDWAAWSAAQSEESEYLTPEDQIVEWDWARMVLIQYLRDLAEATLARTHPWDGWDGTVAEYVTDAILQREREQFDAIQAALARTGA